MESIRIQAVTSEAGKRIVGRLLPGTDLITGIEAMCQQHQVTSATIVSVIGSLTQAQLVYAVPDETGKIGIRYHDPVTVGGPLEILACQGIIGQSEQGALSVHLHGLISDPGMRVVGGHFLNGGNPVLATAEILIQQCSDVRMIREQDDETGFPLFKFYG